MTPFDPVALLAMLLTFYPVVSVRELQRAMRERPDYFAGGELVSTSGEKLRLPDGRIFDLIYDVDGLSGGPRWQVIEPGDGGGGSGWPLEPGPLSVLVPGEVLTPPLDPVFESLVAAQLGDVARNTIVLEQRAGELAREADPSGFETLYQTHAMSGARALEQHIRAMDELYPGTGSANADGLTGRIADAQQDYPDPETTAPGDIGVDPSRRDHPPNEGPGSPWYQQ